MTPRLLERFAATHGGVVLMPRDAGDLRTQGGVTVSPQGLREALASLASDGAAVRLEKGAYAFRTIAGGPQPLAIASRMGGPGAYVTLLAGAAHLGLVDSDTNAIAVASNLNHRPLAVDELGFAIYFRRSAHLFGSQLVQVGSVNARIATPERLLIDVLWFEQGPGSPTLSELVMIWERASGLASFNPRLLTTYAKRMGSGRLARRVGYLMDRFGIPGSDQLASNLGTERSYVPLFPGTAIDWPSSALWRIDPRRRQ